MGQSQSSPPAANQEGREQEEVMSGVAKGVDINDSVQEQTGKSQMTPSRRSLRRAAHSAGEDGGGRDNGGRPSNSAKLYGHHAASVAAETEQGAAATNTTKEVSSFDRLLAAASTLAVVEAANTNDDTEDPMLSFTSTVAARHDSPRQTKSPSKQKGKNKDDDNDDTSLGEIDGRRSSRKRTAPTFFVAKPTDDRPPDAVPKPRPKPPPPQTVLKKKEFTNNDILSGDRIHSQDFRSHPGNRRYCAIVEKYRTKYQNSKAGPNRRAVLEEVLKEIQSNGARFLMTHKNVRSKSNQKWIEMEPSKLRGRVSDALRYVNPATKTTGGSATSRQDQSVDSDDSEEGNEEINDYKDQDVLCGDKKCNLDQRHTILSHPGNQRYYVILEKYLLKYQAAEVAGPTRKVILQQVLAEIQSDGARFLTRVQNDNNQIIWVDMEMIKVKQKLRDALGNWKPRSMTHKKASKSIYYSSKDILCYERQKHCGVTHPGNQRYSAILEKYCKEYQSLPSGGHAREVLLQRVLEEIQSNGARFMGQEETNWVRETGAGKSKIKKEDVWVEWDAAKAKGKVIRALRRTKVTSNKKSTGILAPIPPRYVPEDEDEEEEEEVQDSTPQYDDEDILCGRGLFTYKHPANERYRSIVAKHQKEFNETNERNEKDSIVRTVIEEAKSKGGRFMTNTKAEKHVWFELDAKQEKSKVFKALLLLGYPDNVGETNDQNNEGDNANEKVASKKKRKKRAVATDNEGDNANNKKVATKKKRKKPAVETTTTTTTKKRKRSTAATNTTSNSGDVMESSRPSRRAKTVAAGKVKNQATTQRQRR